MHDLGPKQIPKTITVCVHAHVFYLFFMFFVSALVGNKGNNNY